MRWPHCEKSRLKFSSLREALVELDARVVEARALGRLVVRAQDRRVAPGRARADVALLEDADVGDPALAQVVGGGQAVRAAADDDDVVGVLQRAGAGATCAAGGRCHARATSRSQRVDARPARRPGPRRRRPPRSTCTRPAPSRRASGSGRRPRAGRSRACAPPIRGGSRRTGIDCGRRSSAQKRAKTSRASGPTMASAASAVVTSTAPRRVGTRARRSRARASRVTRAPPRAVRRASASAEARGRGGRVTSSLRRCETSAQPTGALQALALAGGRRRRRSSRRAAPSARRRRAPGPPSGCGRRRRPRARGTRSALTSAGPRRRGRRTAWS